MRVTTSLLTQEEEPWSAIIHSDIWMQGNIKTVTKETGGNRNLVLRISLTAKTSIETMLREANATRSFANRIRNARQPFLVLVMRREK